MNRPLTHALLCAASLFIHAGAQAGEITLFKDDNFRGPSLTLREPAEYLVNQGFNDKVSSIIVHSGTWQVCVDGAFRGACRVLERGEYPSMPGMNDAISSVREVPRGSGGYNPGYPGRDPDRNPGRDPNRDPDRGHGHGGYGRGSTLEMYTSSGAAVRINRDVEALSDIGFNDRATGIYIDRGYWQLCSNWRYQGTCRIFGQGRFENLGRGLDGQVSSVRQVDPRDARRQEHFTDQREPSQDDYYR